MFAVNLQDCCQYVQSYFTSGSYIARSRKLKFRLDGTFIQKIFVIYLSESPCFASRACFASFSDPSETSRRDIVNVHILLFVAALYVLIKDKINTEDQC